MGTVECQLSSQLTRPANGEAVTRFQPPLLAHGTPEMPAFVRCAPHQGGPRQVTWPCLACDFLFPGHNMPGANGMLGCAPWTPKTSKLYDFNQHAIQVDHLNLKLQGTFSKVSRTPLPPQQGATNESMCVLWFLVYRIEERGRGKERSATTHSPTPSVVLGKRHQKKQMAGKDVRAMRRKPGRHGKRLAS